MRAVAWILVALLAVASQAATPRPKVLFFANPMSSDNDVVRRAKSSELSVAESHFRALSEGVFDTTTTQNGSDLGSREKLARYDAIVFFTAINPPGVDIDALVAWVRDGGAFAGIHSTANTYQNHAGFGDMLGARYDRRPWRTASAPQTKVRILVETRRHPATRHFGEAFELTDDIYQFKGFDSSSVTLLLRLDPASLDLANPKVNRSDQTFPIAWTKSFGRGRVFYTALGDWEPTWSDPRYRIHLIQGILWTLAK
jgi:uncharacterized protein